MPAPLGGAVPYEWLLGSLLLRWPATKAAAADRRLKFSLLRMLLT
jgi:hypothetical protein